MAVERPAMCGPLGHRPAHAGAKPRGSGATLVGPRQRWPGAGQVHPLLARRGGAYGIRTRVTGVRGQRPRPLDECARRTRRVADGFRASGRQPVSAAMGRGPGAPPRWREARRGGKCYLRHPPRRRPRPNALAWLPAPLVRPARSRANVGELTTVCQRPGSAHCSEQRELHRDENSGDDEPHPPGHSRS